MGVALGIHGGAGIAESPILDAAALAALLVDTLLREVSAGAGHRVVAMLNGLGSTKYGELFVLWRFIAPLLRQT